MTFSTLKETRLPGQYAINMQNNVPEMPIEKKKAILRMNELQISDSWRNSSVGLPRNFIAHNTTPKIAPVLLWKEKDLYR